MVEVLFMVLTLPAPHLCLDEMLHPRHQLRLRLQVLVQPFRHPALRFQGIRVMPRHTTVASGLTDSCILSTRTPHTYTAPSHTCQLAVSDPNAEIHLYSH